MVKFKTGNIPNPLPPIQESTLPLLSPVPHREGVRDTQPGGGLPYERDGDARRKIRIRPLKETNLGVAQALFHL